MNKARILAVDDNTLNLEIITRAFAADTSKEVVTVTTGEEALRLCRVFIPSVILLDVMIPNGIDGYETCRRIRMIRELDNTAIIMLSARSITDERLEGYKAGAQLYVAKPYSYEELRRIVDNFVNITDMDDRRWYRPNIKSEVNHGSLH